MSAPVVDRATWLAMKRSPIITLGSSHAAAACGLDPYDSPLSLYYQLRGDIEADDLSGNEHVYFGNLLEPVIIREAAKRLGIEVWNYETDFARRSFESAFDLDGQTRILAWVRDDESGRIQPFMQSTARLWQVATLDAIGLDDRGSLVIIEAKNQGARRSVEWDESRECPDVYRMQALHQLAVVPGAECVHLSAFVGGNTFRSARIAQDESVRNLIKVESHFMSNLAAGIEPTADAHPATRDALLRLHPDDDGTTTILPRESVEITAKYRELGEQLAPLCEQVKALEGEQNALKNRIAQFIGSHTFGQLPNGMGRWELRTQNTVNGGTTRVPRFKANSKRKTK